MWNLVNKPYQPWIDVDNAFSANEIKKIVAFKDDHKKQQAIVGVGESAAANEDIRQSDVWWLTDYEKSRWLYEKVTNIVLQMNQQWFGMDLETIQTLQLTEYDGSKKGHYGQHVDNSYVPGNSQNRKLSFSLQLSDPEYEGGELRLYTANFENPTIIKKEIGKMTMFRSHIIHEVTPVTKGVRYSLVGWVQGPLFR